MQNDYEQQKVKMKANKVLFITQEITPYVSESE
ncbi:MAG: glycogen synthase, partial [Phocaeicola dorei]|nr:glycogen synthase [Phocaeicola dorei]